MHTLSYTLNLHLMSKKIFQQKHILKTETVEIFLSFLRIYKTVMCIQELDAARRIYLLYCFFQPFIQNYTLKKNLHSSPHCLHSFLKNTPEVGFYCHYFKQWHH